MNSQNSLSIILKEIIPGSKILEFGPAMGRMTKYLKQNLNCDVYIIELDEEGYNSSIKYAIDGYFGNAESIEWIERFKGIKFDYIIFADIIEHLRNPEEVIIKAKDLLNYQGKVIFSVPNIAHNSVLIDLINNKFNYSQVGLLDNTHIKFYTYFTLKEMLNRCNLIVCNEKATYAKTDETEFYNNYDMVSKELSDKLKSREFGDVYQFIFTCLKNEDYLINQEDIIIEKNIKKVFSEDSFKIYINDGGGLNENNVITKRIFMGNNQINIDINNFNIENEVRLDFTEESCILKIYRLNIDHKSYDIESLRGNYSCKFKNCFIFLKNDPFLFLDEIPFNYKKLFIEFTISRLSVNNLTEDYLFNVSNELEAKLNDILEKDKILMELNDKLETNQNTIKQKNIEIEKVKECILNKNSEIEQNNNEIVKLKDNVNQLDNIINKLNFELDTLKTNNSQMNDTIKTLNLELERINKNLIIKLNNKIFKNK
jgi:2-polyprenyl-3-methyl-5-hydroxy-6-metoxy-1,4-benzoquinol methylase